jgi:hypothetical protein
MLLIIKSNFKILVKFSKHIRHQHPNERIQELSLLIGETELGHEEFIFI